MHACLHAKRPQNAVLLGDAEMYEVYLETYALLPLRLRLSDRLQLSFVPSFIEAKQASPQNLDTGVQQQQRQRISDVKGSSTGDCHAAGAPSGVGVSIEAESRPPLPAATLLQYDWRGLLSGREESALPHADSHPAVAVSARHSRRVFTCCRSSVPCFLYVWHPIFQGLLALRSVADTMVHALMFTIRGSCPLFESSSNVSKMLRMRVKIVACNCRMPDSQEDYLHLLTCCAGRLTLGRGVKRHSRCLWVSQRRLNLAHGGPNLTQWLTGR